MDDIALLLTAEYLSDRKVSVMLQDRVSFLHRLYWH